MEELLGEFPPIGRKMEDLISIIGARGVSSGDPSNGETEFDVCGGGSEMDIYIFRVRDGLIRSLRRAPHN